MFKRYYQLTKPGIIYGNIMTVAAGYLLASKWHIDFTLFASLLIGTSLIIASGCVINNYIDRGIDAKMARTKKRALVSGEVSGKNALIYAFALAALGFSALTYTNLLTFGIGFVAIFSYVVLYGIAKRRSVYGTLIGTVPGSASLIAGYTAVTNQLDSAVAILFLTMVAWQMAHFYSITIFRFSDYKAAGLPVWPVKKGMESTRLQIILYIFIFVLTAASLSIYGFTGLIYLITVTGIGLYWLWKGMNGSGIKNDKEWAREMFGISLITLLVFSAALSVGSVLP